MAESAATESSYTWPRWRLNPPCAQYRKRVPCLPTDLENGGEDSERHFSLVVLSAAPLA